MTWHLARMVFYDLHTRPRQHMEARHLVPAPLGGISLGSLDYLTVAFLMQIPHLRVSRQRQPAAHGTQAEQLQRKQCPHLYTYGTSWAEAQIPGALRLRDRQW